MENINENNKLISEYFYPDFIHPKNNNDNWEKEESTPILEMCKGSLAAMAVLLFEDYKNLNYHNSYNALIPIIKEIMNDTSFNINEYEESTGWYAYYSIESLVSYADIEKVYEEVIKFIKWYNKLKK